MACYKPLIAYRLASGDLSFSERGEVVEQLSLPCGKCIGCKLDRGKEWAVRCTHEARMHEFNCFVTLTYDDDHLPCHGFLRHRDFQLFMKRLRKTFSDIKIRYLMCGEYGETMKRAHYHAILFGLDFYDRKPFNRGKSGMLNYTSEILTNIWQNGHCTVSPFSPCAAGYIARYNTKSLDDSFYRVVDETTGELLFAPKEYLKASTHPGLGALFFDKYQDEIVNSDSVILDANEIKLPRYYDKLLRRRAPDTLEALKTERVYSSYGKRSENLPERLEVREQVKIASIQSLRRS